MAKNEILQIVVFSLFFGTGLAACARAAGRWSRSSIAAHVMLKVTGYVMWLAPVACLPPSLVSSRAAASASSRTYGVFMGEFYFGIVLLWLLLFALGSRFSAGASAVFRPCASR
jgi:Na+/H+-dicarboxylate symporter